MVGEAELRPTSTADYNSSRSCKPIAVVGEAGLRPTDFQKDPNQKAMQMYNPNHLKKELKTRLVVVQAQGQKKVLPLCDIFLPSAFGIHLIHLS